MLPLGFDMHLAAPPRFCNSAHVLCCNWICFSFYTSAGLLPVRRSTLIGEQIPIYGPARTSSMIGTPIESSWDASAWTPLLACMQADEAKFPPKGCALATSCLVLLNPQIMKMITGLKYEEG